MLNAYSISCIQHPETGRELEFGTIVPATLKKRIMVAGGGPAGMKVACIAAARGHKVTLCESASTLGGQVNLAQLLPGRTEFGGLVTNLRRELENESVEIRLNMPVTPKLVNEEDPDAVIIATGAVPFSSYIEGAEEAHVVTARQVLEGKVNIGARAVVADWRCDWVGLGLAERLARDGCHVRLAVNGMVAGQTIPQYARDAWLGILHKLGVEIIPHVRLFGVDSKDAYFQHTLSGEPVVMETVDTLVTALGNAPNTELEQALNKIAVPHHVIGDSLSPRTAEEAILEGLKVGSAL